jgi:Fic family protein
MPRTALLSKSKGVTWRAGKPYNGLPGLPPALDVETARVLKDCIPARAALGELKQAAQSIPNQSVLIKTLPLLEAQSSSEIENVITTTDKLFQNRAHDAAADPATKEALRYGEALLDGFRSLAKLPLTTRMAEAICSKILGSDMRVRRVPGTALAKDTRGGQTVVYTPPEGEDLIRNLLANWERYMHEETRIEPLVRLAVGHYQFEAIHPFTDGNGRTGRVLNSLFLIHQGLLTLPILYLSRYIIQHRTDYYRLLLGVTSDGNWEDWLLYLIRGVRETADWTRAKVEAIRRLMEHTGDFVRRRRPKIYSYELLTLIFELPYCRIQNVVQAKIAKRQAASRYLKELVDIGVLQERTVGRDKLFTHPKFLGLLTQDGDVDGY